MEIKHASPESFFRYVHCERCNNAISRHEIVFKNQFFNTTSKQNEVCYEQACLNCRNVFKRKFIAKILATTIEKWNLFVEKGFAP